MHVVVVGAGVLGIACALAVARAGAKTSLIDPGPPGLNASAIAAGMLAPAMESALDETSAGRFALLAQARDLWPEFVRDIGPVGLEPCGALYSGPEADMSRIFASLTTSGAAVEMVRGRLFTPEDWRIEPLLALAAMRAGFLALGGTVVSQSVASVAAYSATLATGGVLEADAIILACGYGALSLAPELAVLTPIKGQLLRYPDAGPREGAILRGPSGYVVPGRSGAVAGATMEPGVNNLAIDPMTVERLRAAATLLAPDLAGVEPRPLAGLRAATPDGLPMMGASSISGVWLATGARRNGWLFAPLCARIIAAQVTGENQAPGGGAAQFSPDRFSGR